MGIEIRQVHPVFVGEVNGIDLRRPLEPAEVAAIEAGMDRYAVLVFRNQPLTDDQQLAFSLNLGSLETGEKATVTRPEERRLPLTIADISNLDQNNKLLDRNDRRRMFNLGNRLWHSDSSFRAISAKYSLLSARQVPKFGGNTEFADMRAAYDALDDDTKQEVETLICEHSLIYSRRLLGFSEFDPQRLADYTPVRQSLVRTHPVSGRKSLFLSSHAGTILGWPDPEALAFLRDLMEHATQPQFVHVHQWRQHDLVIWDNRQTMHRGRRYRETEEIRDLHRTTVAGDSPTVSQVDQPEASQMAG